MLIFVRITFLIKFYNKFMSRSHPLNSRKFVYDEESDHSNKAVRKTPEIESGHKVLEEVK